MRYLLLTLTLAFLGISAASARDLSADTIVSLAYEEAGGDIWLTPETLTLEGTATFFGGGAEPSAIADDYRMWRVFDPNRDSAHGAEGKVRIRAMIEGRRIFEVGFNGDTTWTERGILPKAEADAFWAANYGFGIIRQALAPHMQAERLPDVEWGGGWLHTVRLTDPGGGITIFNIDPATYRIIRMGFDGPRGWHERVYANFQRLPNGWLQPMRVTLYYDGVRQNTVDWRTATVDAPLQDALFAYPGDSE